MTRVTFFTNTQLLDLTIQLDNYKPSLNYKVTRVTILVIQIFTINTNIYGLLYAVEIGTVYVMS